MCWASRDIQFILRRYHTTLDYIFVPNCLLSSITSAETFEADPDNTSDHLPIQLTLTINYKFASCSGNSQHSKKKPKIKWSKFSLEVINTQYVTPLLHDLENGDIDFSDSGKAVDKISKLITHHSASLADPSVVTAKGRNKRNVYVRLPEDVKTARSHCKVAFESWKNNDYSEGNGINENYHSKRREYHFKLRNILSKLEAEKITKLCNAADSDEKLFWRLLKGQQSTSQMTAFLVDGKLIMDKSRFVRYGLITLRHWVPLQSVYNMITIFLPMLLPASKISLTPVQKTHPEFK